MKKSLFTLVGGILLLTSISACSKSQKEIEAGFTDFLSLYPTENLMDFYDKEGFRDEEFAEDDKGVWYLQTDITERRDNVLYTEGMTLKINRNTGKAQGEYSIMEGYSDFKKNTKKDYFVTFDETGYQLVEENVDPTLKEKILNFKFLSQYVSFKNYYFSQHKNIRKMYNPELPLYELKYELNQKDQMIQEIVQHYPEYNLVVDPHPILTLKRTGPLEGASVGDRRMQILLIDNRDLSIRSSISYSPDEVPADEG